MGVESILNVQCSRANNKESSPVDCNLLEELLTNKYEQQQNELRLESDPDVQDDLKQKMAVLIPSGIFKKTKSIKGFRKHSGFIAVDIDEKDNKHVQNFYDLKKEFCKIPNVAYCGLSIRGKGYWLLIPIANPDKHKLHFKYLEQYFKSKGIKIDHSGINVNRLRFYSYDPDAYFNHNAKTLQSYYIEPNVKIGQSYKLINNNQSLLTRDVFGQAINWVKQKGLIFCEGQRHQYIFYLCSYLHSKGININDTKSWIDRNLIPLTAIQSNCIDYPYKNYHNWNILPEEKKLTRVNQPYYPKPESSSKKYSGLIKSLSKIEEPVPIVLSSTHEQTMGLFEKKSKLTNQANNTIISWENDIAELESYFNTIELPTFPLTLKKGETIGNISSFLKSHLATLKTNNGNKTFYGCLERLIKLKNIIANNELSVYTIK